MEVSRRLRERIVVKKKSTVENTQGGRAVTWVDLVSGSATNLTKLWADVDPVLTDEALADSTAMTAKQMYRVVLRYRPAITATMRVFWTPYRASSEKTLEIHGVRLLDRAFMQLDCAETA